METRNGFVKFLHWGKDGGPNSKVWGFWLLSIKPLFGIALLRFDEGSREAYHEHAFNAVSWLLRGLLLEQRLWGLPVSDLHQPSWRPIVTKRDTFHKVWSYGTSWVLTFRGPWAGTWREAVECNRYQAHITTLTHGRKVLKRELVRM